ncbi:hypothetical protein DSM104299_05503 [Baekduia alba]|uniref:arginine--tRNA ligase domain-containing protein n=1 Tax=Baekduia alba TaxID=2997333 RepID=UPI00234257EC|nr:arginine--tRNA ligase [Baekduia alba]WCB96737.1 hypothetical protein DSM104299_05503 [Baekduia alba]
MFDERGTPQDDDQRAAVPRRAERLGALRAAVRSISTDEHGLKLTGLRSHGPSDLAAVLRDSCDSNNTLVHATQALGDEPDVAVAQRAGRRVLLRLEDDVIAEMGETLEHGVADLQPAEDSAFAGTRFMIQFLDPNATKALHVGHLRNVALGQAFRCALLAAGADAWSRSAIGDAGQQIGEAMAGCVQYGGGRATRAPGVKGDRVVGEWYARYVAENRVAVVDEDEAALVDAPCAREVICRDDLATRLLRRWQDGDPEVRAIWRDIRDWAVAGQNDTLARLGVVFDVEISEAETFPRIADFVREGLARDAMRHAASGALVYETGDEDYPVFALARPDGFPTQNLRTLTLWYELMQRLDDAQVINVVGEEWRPHTIYVQQILQRMGMGVPVLPTHDVVHGMICAVEGADMSSSCGDVVLVDDLLDALAASPQLRSLAVCGRPGCDAEDLGVMAALAFCLNRPLSKGMVMSAERILDPQASSGMLLARAWSKAWSPTSDGAAAPAPDDPAYRFAVMYCQFQADVLEQGLATQDLLGVIRSVTRMAKWYVGTPSSPAVDRVMRSLLTRGLRALGVQSAPVAFGAAEAVAAAPPLLAAAQR